MKQIAYVAVGLLLFACMTVALQAEDTEARLKKVLQKAGPSIVTLNGRKGKTTGVVVDTGWIITTGWPKGEKSAQIRQVNGKTAEATLHGADWLTGVALFKTDLSGLKALAAAKNIETADWVALVGRSADLFPAIYHGIVNAAADDNLVVDLPLGSVAAGAAILDKKAKWVAMSRRTTLFVSGEVDMRYFTKGDLFGKAGGRVIPARKVLELVKELKAHGKIRRGWLGVTLETDEGVAVDEVLSESPAEKAGLASGDRIVQISGNAVEDVAFLVDFVRNQRAGDTIALRIKREGQTMDINVTLGEMKEQDMAFWRQGMDDFDIDIDMDDLINWRVYADKYKDYGEKYAKKYKEYAKKYKYYAKDMKKQIKERMRQIKDELKDIQHYLSKHKILGVEVRQLNEAVAKKLDITQKQGLLVDKVVEDSAAQEAELREGDILLTANGTELQVTDDLVRAIQACGEESLQLEVLRDGKKRTISAVPRLLIMEEIGEHIQKEIEKALQQELTDAQDQLEEAEDEMEEEMEAFEDQKEQQMEEEAAGAPDEG